MRIRCVAGAGALLAAGAFLLAGCGGDDGPPAPAQVADLPPPIATADRAADPQPEPAVTLDPPREPTAAADVSASQDEPTPSTNTAAAAAGPAAPVDEPTPPTVAAAAAAGPVAPVDDPPNVDSEQAPEAPAAQPLVKTVVLDPGHGGDDPGAAAFGVVERESNLDMALRVERLLVGDGIRVILTRHDEGRVTTPDAALSESGTAFLEAIAERFGRDNVRLRSFAVRRADLQARVDIANAEGADLFVSIHSNGSTIARQAGVEVWYDPNRPFSADNLVLAQALQRRVVAELSAYGYTPADRGVMDDSCWRFSEQAGQCFPLFVLGPARVILRDDLRRFELDPAALGLPPDQEIVYVPRATQMPAALVELLFISNEDEAALLRDDAARDAAARGVAEAIREFLQSPKETDAAPANASG